MMKKTCGTLILLCLLLAACEDDREIEILQRQHLFSLSLGKMENQIDLFQIEGVPQQTKNKIYLKAGMFYLANGNSSKVIKLTTFGDLLFMLYNPETNPPPLVLRDVQESEVVTNRYAAKFKLHNIGEIAVDSGDMLYLEDKVPSEQKIWDERLGVNLDSRVLKFNSKGQLIHYIGREGAGNSLFPYITSLSINQTNDLIVICRLPLGWQVYWFSENGQLLHSLFLDQAKLTDPAADVISIDNIFPSYTSPRLYIQQTYYKAVQDSSTNTLIGIDNIYSRVYTVNMVTGAYEKYVTLPDPGLHKYYTDSGEKLIPASSFDFLGITAEEYYFLIRPEEEDRFQLLILDPAGKIYADRFVIIEDYKLFFKELKMTDEGLLYGLLCWKEKAELVWWRSDKLLGEKLK